jgi:hypothetical protein
VGYRSLNKFVKANEEYFTNIFSLKHGVPSHVTIIMYPQFRTVFQLDGSIAKFGIMNKHSKRKFTPEFKFKVALEALQEKQTLAEIAGNGAARAV